MPNQLFAISDVQDSAGLVFDIFHSPRHRMRLRKNAPAREATEARVSPFLKGQAHSSMASRRAQLLLRQRRRRAPWRAWQALALRIFRTFTSRFRLNVRAARPRREIADFPSAAWSFVQSSPALIRGGAVKGERYQTTLTRPSQ